MFVGLGLVAILGIIGLRDRDADQGAANRVATSVLEERTKVVRVSGEAIEFARLGVRVNPSDGWSHLSNSRVEHTQTPIFMNEAHQLIVRIHPFAYRSWPPSEQELTERKIDSRLTELKTDASSLADAEPRHVQYEHVAVDWIDIERWGSQGTGIQVGRLFQDDCDVLVTVVAHSKNAEIDESLAKLCDSIEVVSVR